MTVKRFLPTLSYLFLGAFSVLVSQYVNKGLSSTEGFDQRGIETTTLSNGAFVQVVKLNSTLSEEDLVSKAKTRAEEFRALPGLVQKYYVKLSDNGDYSGIYIWDSKASFLEYKSSDLAKTIGQAYQVTAPPSVDVGDMLFLLRE